MKKRHLIPIGLTAAVLLALPIAAGAGEGTISSGLSLFGGLFTPSLNLISEGPIYSDIGSVDAETVTRGETPMDACIGVGLTSRNSSGFASRFAYMYKREAEMVYTISSASDYEIVYEADEKPKFKYTIHMLTIALMKHIRLVPSGFSIYLGGGVGGALLIYPETNNDVKYSPGVTGFPLVGVEMMMGSHLGLFSEFQFHFGRTLDQHYSIGEGSDSSTIDYHYSLKGAHLLGGVNLYF